MKKSKSSVLASLQSIADGRTVSQEHWLNTAKPKELERNIQCSQAIKAAGGEVVGDCDQSGSLWSDQCRRWV